MTQFKKGELAIVKEVTGSAREFYNEGETVVITEGNSVDSSAVEVKPVGKTQMKGIFSNIFWVNQLERVTNKVLIDGEVGQHGLLRGIHCWQTKDKILFENTELLTNGQLYLNRDANINGEIKDVIGFAKTVGLPNYANQIIWDGEKIDLSQYSLGDTVKGLMARYRIPDVEEDLVEGVITTIDEPTDNDTIKIKVTVGDLKGAMIWLDNAQGIEIINKAEPAKEKLSFDELTEKFTELTRNKKEYERKERQVKHYTDYVEEITKEKNVVFKKVQELENELSEYLNI